MLTRGRRLGAAAVILGGISWALWAVSVLGTTFGVDLGRVFVITAPPRGAVAMPEAALALVAFAGLGFGCGILLVRGNASVNWVGRLGFVAAAVGGILALRSLTNPNQRLGIELWLIYGGSLAAAIGALLDAKDRAGRIASLALACAATLLLIGSQMAFSGPGSLFALTFDAGGYQRVSSIWTRIHVVVEFMLGTSWTAFGWQILRSRTAPSPAVDDDTATIGRLPVMSWPATAALIAWTVFVVFGLALRELAPRVSTILRRVGGPAAGHPFVATPYGVEWFLSPLAIWTFGVVVILAIGYVIRQQRPSLDVIAVAVWTMGFVVFAISAPSDVYCPSPDDLNSTCYSAWWPGFTRFGIWLAVSALILVVGEGMRWSGRGRAAPHTPRQGST
jgi:hypothetical protein